MERFMHVKMKFMAHIKFLGTNIIKTKILSEIHYQKK